MKITKHLLFLLICFLIPITFLELLSGYFISQRYTIQKIEGLSKSSAISLLIIIRQEYWPNKSSEIHDHSRDFIIQNGDFKKILSDESMRQTFERIYEGKSIEIIRREWKQYHDSIYSYRPNTLNHLMTLAPDGSGLPNRKLGDMISIGERGEREGTVNQTKKECWVFGGSTVWGDRIHGSETITSHLNKLQNKYLFLNYGIPGYNSNSQLEFFIFAHKKRRLIPNCVVWLDGLNDGNSIWLSPITEAYERTSHDDRPPSKVLDLSKTLNLISPLSLINRDAEAMDKLLLLKKFDLISFNKISQIVKDDILTGKIHLSGNEQIFKEATANHLNNAFIMRSIINGLSEGKSKFYWFIQPNGELNEKNPFLLKDHYTSNRYYIHKNYQQNLLIGASGFAIDLTKIDIDCDFCYVDEAHYSPLFSKKIAVKILEAIQ